MKFGVLVPIIIYYGVMAILFTFGSGILVGYTDNGISSMFGNPALQTGYTSINPIDYLFALFGFLGLGIGLPVTTPLFISVAFVIWSVAIDILAIALIYQMLRAS